MHEFMVYLKRRFCCKYTVAAVLVGVLLLVLTWLIRNYPYILQYLDDIDPNNSYWQQARASTILSDDAFQRLYEYRVALSRSDVFSFFALLGDSHMLYTNFGNLLLTLPVLSFFAERKSGFIKFVVLRNGSYHDYLVKEGLAVSLSGWLIALLPSLIIWFLAAVFSPDVLSLNGAELVTSTAIFRSFFQGPERLVVFAYLITMALTSLQFFFNALLAFAFALFVDKGVVLLFVPFLYVNLFNFLLWPTGYGISYEIMGVAQTMSYAPLALTSLFTFVVALLLLKIFVNREKVFHG